MLSSYSAAGIRARRSLLVRLASRGFASRANSLEKDKSVWLNEHSSRILEVWEEKGDVEKRRGYEILIEGVHRRKELLLSYNIGVPVEEREKEMNKRAAKLVGLRMPDDPSKA